MYNKSIASIEDARIITNQNEIFLNSYKPLVKSISKIFGPNCQVSLYSINKTQKVCIEIENGHITGQDIGSPIPSLMEDILKDKDNLTDDSVGIYYIKTGDGRPLKSIATIIRNHNDQIIGCLCIYIDVSIPLYEFIQTFLPVVDDGLSDALSDASANDSFNDVEQLIYTTLERVISDVNNYRGISGTEKNKKIVKELDEKGIFNIRGAVEIIAKQLGVSRYTIYNYIKEV